jgi:benzodiazapine receptor
MTSSNTSTTSAAASIGVFLSLVCVCYGVAGVGAFFTAPEIATWYAALAKPSFNPPNWIFAPVWTALYGFMAIAAWLVWRTPKLGVTAASRRAGLILFVIQLCLNALWTPLFFRFHQLLAALIVIVFLWVAIVLATVRFWQVDRLAGVLMLFYLAWVSFATALNFEIYRLN